MATHLKELGGFEVLEKIGEGGMGAVYKVRQKSLDRIVALKILPPNLAKKPGFVERFQREARASAALNHPNIVQGIDVGEDQGLHYLAMEFVEGETLGGRFKREGPLPLRDVWEVGRQAARALAHAHAKGLIHRDIKPDNLMLAKSGRSGELCVKVMDLGLARMLEDDAALTQTGTCVGTPYYIAPEQARGQAAGPACDLYALGGTLFHVVTGQPPFPGETSAVIMARHLTEPPPNPKALRPDLPNDFAALLKKLLAKRPTDRYPSAEALAEDLERLLKGQALQHVKASAPRGRTTGPVSPVSGRHAPPIAGKAAKVRGGDSDDFTPVTGTHAPSKTLGRAPVLGLVALAILGLVLFLFMSGRSSTPAPAQLKAAGAQPAQPSAEKKGVGVEVKDPAQAASSEEQARLKRMEELYRAAQEVATRSAADLDLQERVWLELKTVGAGSQFRVLAEERLSALAKKRHAAAAETLQAFLAQVDEKSHAGDHDAALSMLRAQERSGGDSESQEALEKAAQKIHARAQAQGEKLLGAAAALEKEGRLEAALEAYAAAAGFKFAPVAAEARKRSERIGTACEEAKLASAKAAHEAFAALVQSVQEKVNARKLEEARSEAAKALQDPALSSKASALHLLTEGLKGVPELGLLVSRRLAGGGAEGLQLPGSKCVYFKLEKERLYYKPTPDFPQLTNKSIEYAKWEELLALGGLSDPKAAPEKPKDFTPEQHYRLAGLLALLGQVAQARRFMQWSQEAGGSEQAARVAAGEEVLAILEYEAAESGAALRLKKGVDLVAQKRWAEAQEVRKELLGERFAKTAFLSEHKPEFEAWAEKILAAQVEAKAEAVPLEKLFKGRLKLQPDGRVELSYDFEDPAQFQDFQAISPNWKIEAGRLQVASPPANGQVWLKAAFQGEALEVYFEGDAPTDLNCLLGPEIKDDTLGGYSFRFGRTKNQHSVVLNPADRVLARNEEKLWVGQGNRVVVVRRGKTFTGQLNAAAKPLTFTEADPPATRHVSLQTWERAWFDNLRVAGRLDPEWIKAERQRFIRRQGAAGAPPSAPLPAKP